MSLDPNVCSSCGGSLDLEMEREDGLCVDCQAEAAGCTNGEPARYCPLLPDPRYRVMKNELHHAAALMAARLQVNRAYRASLEECGEKEAILPVEEIFGPKDREALAAYEAHIQEALGARPLPFPLENAS